MLQAIQVLVTHEAPDLDAVVSVYLWLKANGIAWDSGPEVYEMEFVRPGQRLWYKSKALEQAAITHFDTGRKHDDNNFDHHHLNNREISATGLVWQRFFTPGDNPAIDELVTIVNHSDNGRPYFTEDLVARNIFSIRFFLGGANKSVSDNDYSHVMVMGFSMLDAYLANHAEVQLYKELTKDIVIFDSALGKTVILENVPGTPAALRSYYKKYHNDANGPLVNSCLAQFSEPAGKIGVMVFYDPGQDMEYPNDNENEEYPETISLGSVMQDIHDKLKGIDPHSKIFLHYSKFVLFINRSHTIELPDVEMILRGITRRSNVSDCSQAQ